jgi:hypothetical protein
MRRERPAAALAAALVVAGCAGSDAFAPTSVPSAGMPYAGLHENSYGPRSTTRLRLCGPDADRGRLASIAALAARPAQGLLKVDATLHGLDLTRHFTNPLGTGVPPVAVLSHAADGIVFWHALCSVPLAEVETAARAWCSGQRRGLLYRGSSTHCPPHERGLAGESVVTTYAISAYACTGRL